MVKKSLLTATMAALLISSVPMQAGWTDIFTKIPSQVCNDVKGVLPVMSDFLQLPLAIAAFGFTVKGIVTSGSNMCSGLKYLYDNLDNTPALKRAPQHAWQNIKDRSKDFGIALGCTTSYYLLKNITDAASSK